MASAIDSSPAISPQTVDSAPLSTVYESTERSPSEIGSDNMVESVIQSGDSSAATEPVALDTSSVEGRALRERSGDEVSTRD